MKNISQRLNEIKNKITSENFLKNKTLGNEIGFYIFDYDPKDELQVRKHIKLLVNNFSSGQIKIKEFNLYKMLIEMLIEENILQDSFKMEKDGGESELFEAITTFANPDEFIKKIKAEKNGYSVIFITGVGEIYPFLRSHIILNKLHPIIENIPVVLFFPGEYNKRELNLFNKLKDDNYYRAFPLVE
ncbi:MAG TPA: DUF1788 domain-containing protein [Tepiditoga sp.]|nr:DUF1788 domain-containing protein [Tepiditoga sp.]